jgi:hypothetical protein
LGRRLLGNILDGGHDSGELAGVVEHLVGAHHDQALHAVIGMQADGAVGRRRRLVQAHQDAAAGLAHRALEDLLAMLAQHFIAGHAKELFRRPVYAGDAEFGIVKNQSVGKLVKDRFQNAGSLPAWGELRH